MKNYKVSWYLNLSLFIISIIGVFISGISQNWIAMMWALVSSALVFTVSLKEKTYQSHMKQITELLDAAGIKLILKD